ncbi:MAG: DegT/DnrJ/EryC1/StrS family aminotransferase [Acidobacteria bacterium]|nr:DegT/DnrJ/EryC1/StrS family aminotransferase [Acidobacteriota bacterium]
MQTSNTNNPIIRMSLRPLWESFNYASGEDNHLWGGGAVAELEGKLRRHYGMKRAICVSSATSGLLAIGLALGLRNREFITTPYTYGASLAAWLLLGNRPVFTDVNQATLGLSPEAVRKAITPKTKAILAVDIFGVPADTAALRAVAEEHDLFYIADAAQSFGASRNGILASSRADALVTSFTAGKALSAGEGGAVVTDNEDLYQKILWYSQHPDRQRKELSFSLCNEFGINGRISPLSAARANEAFEDSLQKLRQRQQRCFQIIEVLNSTGLTEPIRFSKQSILPSFFRLTASWKRKPREEQLLASLFAHGVEARIERPPVTLIYEQAAFRTQYGRRFRIPYPCVNAETQFAQRFCVTE